MGRKAAYTGESASDRATNIMDKFIKRNNNKNQVLQNSTARQKDPNVPINLWPFKDQIEYYNNRSAADIFDESYSSYSTWYTIVRKKSGIYHRTFDEFIAFRNLKPALREMWEQKTEPNDTVYQLKKLGVY